MASNSFGKTFRITTLTIFSFLLIVTNARSDDTKIRVLFIGNSLTTANNLPQMIADLAKSRNHIMEYDVYAPGGKTFAQHASDPVALSKIKKIGWDFVVLQEQSQAPSFSQGQVQQEVYPFASELSWFIKEANPGAHVVFYMTLAKKNGDQHNAAKVSPELGTYEGMQNRINQSYVNMAMNNDALVAPVGLVWKRVREQYPSIDLYADETHPNLTGSYLAACVFFSVLFNDTSIGLPYPSTIDGKTASDIQHTTDEIVRLPGWNWEARSEKLAKLDTSEMPDQKSTSTSAKDFERFIGTWVTSGKKFLIIKSEDDFIAMEHPDDSSPKWSTQFKNIRVEDGKLKFERISSTKDGSQDPYSGKAYGEMKEISNGKMSFRISSTDDMTNAFDIILTNSQNKNFQNASTENKPNMMDIETSFPDGQSNDPLFRVGSEIIYRNDIRPPKGQEEWMKQHKSYQDEVMVGWVHQKLRDSFCQHADCIPDEKYVAEWKIFMNDQLEGIRTRAQQRGETVLPETINEEAMGPLESIMGGPPSGWQTNKALFEHYGGRIFNGNLGYYSPIEASLRLFQEMESKDELEFFDPKLRSRVIKDFENWMLSAVEPDEKFQNELQKLFGMRTPWEHPFWSIESRLFSSTNHLPEGAVSFNADREKKNVQYFDKDGLLVLEEYVDGNNDLVRKKYNKNGEVLSSLKTTKKSGKEVTQVFNKDGLLTGERYFEGDDLISKEYDKDGTIISEKRIDINK